MPRYQATDENGTSITFEGDGPPTEQELDQLFAEHAKANAPVNRFTLSPDVVSTLQAPLLTPEQQSDAARADKRFQYQKEAEATPTEAPSTLQKARYAGAAGLVGAAAQQVGAVKELADIGPSPPSFASHERAMLRAGSRWDYPEIDVTTGQPKGPSQEEQALGELSTAHEQMRSAIKAPYEAVEKPLKQETADLQTVVENIPGNKRVAHLAESIGGMLPYVAEAAIPGVGGAAAVTSGGLAGYKSTLDQATEAYKAQGKSEAEARQLAAKDATRSGLVNAALFAALPGAGKSAAEKLIADRIAQSGPLVQGAVNTLSSSAQGGLVMGAQTLIDSAMAKWSYNPDLTWEQALEEAAKSTVTGAIATGAIHAPMEAVRQAGATRETFAAPPINPEAAQQAALKSTLPPTGPVPETETRNVPGEVPRVMPPVGRWQRTESETPNAIQERSTETVPLGQTPEGSPEVGGQVRQPEKLAVPQTPVEPEAQAAPAIPQEPIDVTPKDYRPAIRIESGKFSGKIEVARPNEGHGELDDLWPEVKKTRGFVDKKGNFLTTLEVARKENPSLVSPDSDFSRYTELTQYIKTAPVEQRPAIWQEIETIKNRNGGMPPKAEVAEPPPAPPETKPETGTPPPPKKPTTTSAPTEDRTPVQILTQSANVKVSVPEGATMVRVTDTKGRTASRPISDINKGANPFRGVYVAKVEAGIVGRDKKFKVVKGDVQVKESTTIKPVVVPSSETPTQGTLKFSIQTNEPNPDKWRQYGESRDQQDANLVARILLPGLRQRSGNDAYSRDAYSRTDSVDLLRPSSSPDAQLNIRGIEAIERLFGKRVVIFRDRIMGERYGGVTHSSEPDVIFVNGDDPHPLISVTAHEIFHQLRFQRPDLYKDIFNALKEDIAENRAQLLKRYGKAYATSEIPEEVLADFFADQVTEPEFWKRFAQKDPSLFERTVNTILQWLNDAIDLLQGKKFDATQYFKDVVKARNVMADALADYAKDKGAGTVEAGGKFSENIEPEEERKSPEGLTPDQAARLAEIKKGNQNAVSGNRGRGSGLHELEPVRGLLPGKTEQSEGEAARAAGTPGEPEPDSHDDTVQIAGKDYTILDRGKFSPAQNAQSVARVHDLFQKTLKLPGEPDTTLDRRPGSTDANMVYRIQSDGFNHDAEGRKLLDEIQKQIESQHHTGGDPSYVSALINAVNKNFAAGNLDGVFSPELINELVSTTVSESSWRGRMLRAITGLPEDLHSIALNAGLYLRRIYASAFGGGEMDLVFKRVMVQFRNYFTENDYQQIEDALSGTDAGKKLTSFFDQLEAFRRSEAGGRLYRILQGKYKPKQPLTPAKLESKSFTNEEASKILEEMEKIGLKPVERPGKKKLTPLEELKLMVQDTSVGRVERDVEAAIQSGERNAGLEAMIRAAAKETDPAKKQALEDDIALMQTDARMAPDEHWIEEGLKEPKFAHWKTIRENWLGYSPTSLDLVRRVIQGDFKGTRFADPKIKPADTRINLDALAKEPEAEVQRVLDAHMANVSADIAHGTPEAKAQVLKMIKEQVAAQLEKARTRARDPMFKAPKAPGTALTPEQAIAQKLNAGLFRDPRLDLPGMVERVAGKSQVTRLTPKLNDLIHQVFETPIYRQAELGKRFSDSLVQNLDVPTEQTENAAKVFDQAFATKFAEAKKRALESAKASLTPTERNIFAKRSLWQKIERGVNAGLFDSGETLRTIAAERGWKPPTDETVATLKKLAIREQQLRELTARETAALEADGDTPEEIEEARSKKEAATTYQRAGLVKRMGVIWAEMTRPLPLSKNPGRMAKLWWEHRANYAAALNELNTFNLLAKVGFTAYRLPMHLTTQLLGHLPTRAIARAMELRKSDLAAGNTTQFWKDVGSALHDSAQATLAALRPALTAARAEMLGRGESRNVDRLLSGINGLERLFQQAKTHWDNGDYVRSTIAHFFAWPRVMAWYVSAVDHWQGTPVEYADIIHRVEMSMRGMGRSEAEISTFKADIFKQMKTEIAGATIEAQHFLENEGIEATEKQVREAAWKIVRRNIYNGIERAGLPADDFEADNKILADTQSWQVPTTGGAGMIVASPLRWTSELASRAGLPMPLARFTNAIATSINYSLMWTPFYKLADFGKGQNRSTWFRTDFDRSQRIAQAALGFVLGSTALGLMSAGVLKMTPPWILDKNERDNFERQGHKLNTLEFVLPGGKFIPLSVLVGPFTLIAPYLYFGGAMQRLFKKRTKAQEKLNKEAKDRGLPPGKIRPVSALEMLGVAGETAFGATLGNRSVSGLSASVTQFGTLNANKTAATAIAPQIPGLPGYQEVSRAMGVAMDKNLASVWDYLVPLPTSKARAVNMLGDPVGTPDAVQRVIQTMTSGTYPWPVDPKDASKETAYKVLFETGYRPPTINPAKGYLINGEYRPMNDAELEKFTVTRGQLLKQTLSQMEGATKKYVQAAFKGVEQQALDSVGAVKVAKQSESASGGAPVAPSVSLPTAARSSAGQRVSAPSTRGGLRSLMASRGRVSGLRSLSPGRHLPRPVHGRLSRSSGRTRHITMGRQRRRRHLTI